MKTFQHFTAEAYGRRPVRGRDYDDYKGMKPRGLGGNFQTQDKTPPTHPAAHLKPKKKSAAERMDAAGKRLGLPESTVPGKPAEKLGAVTAIPQDERKAALERIKQKTAALRKKKGIVEDTELDEGMTMKGFKNQRSRQKQKEKRVADKIAPNRRKDIHTDKASPERAARHRANVDPDFEGNDERNYPGGKLSPKKVRKAKALGELGESAVPGKPAERLGAVTAIPKSEQDAARERLLAKAKAKREKMQEERNDEPGEGPRQKYGDMRGLDRSGAPTSLGGKWQSKERKEAGAPALAKLKKEEIEIGEAEEKDPFGRPGGKYGGVKKGGGYDKGYEAMQKKLKELDKVKTEALDPVGQEDADIDNDGDTDKTDKYLHNRRKAIGKAIAKKRGKNIKEGFSNWRQDLAEVMTDDENDVKIKEKKVNNKIKINPKLGEAVEEIGGTLLEMVEIDEVDYIVESVYDELLDEGYEEDDIEEALEYALIEAKVTFGHDTDKPHQKKTGAGQMVRAVGRLARQKLASKVGGAKKAASAAVARGARKVAKGALGVARKMEGGESKSKTAERKPSTYRGAGAGTKEKVSSGSYTPPTKKKAEKPADPWEGSATTPPKAKTKKATAPKAKASAAAPKRKRKSKLDDLLASVRSEETQVFEGQLKPGESYMDYAKRREAEKKDKRMTVTSADKKGNTPAYKAYKAGDMRYKAAAGLDEKMNLATADMGDVIKDFQQSDAPQFKGKSKEERRKMALAAKLTAERGGRKLGEQMDDSTEISASPTDDKKMEQQKKKIQMQKIRDLTVRLSAARKGVY